MKRILSLAIVVLCSNVIFAQIPNAGFETWTNTSGYDMPTGWDNLNPITTATSTYTCIKGTPGNPGSSYLQLISKTVSGLGVVPGIAVSGVMDMTTFQPKSGFASTARPLSLTGNWQYMAFGSDQGHIIVFLSKWNTTTNKRDTVSFTNYALPGMVMSWGSFTIPLTYQSGAVPDSAIILLSASGTTPVNNSYLYLDNLAFTGHVPGTGVAAIAGSVNDISIYPNPASGITTIKYYSQSSKEVVINVNDISGRMIVSFKSNVESGENKIPLNLSAFAKGIYFVRLTDNQTTQEKKVIIQ